VASVAAIAPVHGPLARAWASATTIIDSPSVSDSRMNSGRRSVEICPVAVRNFRPASHSSGVRSTSRAKACTCLTSDVINTRSRASGSARKRIHHVLGQLVLVVARHPASSSLRLRAQLRDKRSRTEMVNSHGYDRPHRFDTGVSMELRHLRYFVALAEYLSFTRAAQRVHVTQSTLSHQIRQLEEELGQTLFDRIGRKVVTTEAGELFLGFATRALQEVDHGIATLKPSSRSLSGQLRIGTTHTFNIG
jgi:hypothetical protein